MPGALSDRFTGLWSVLARRPAVRDVSLRDALRDSVAWYGLHRRSIAAGLRIGPPNDGLVWIEAERYGLAWPAAAPLARLHVALAEVRVAANPHYYFRAPTPVRAGDHVLDVGACEGTFALECLSRFDAAHVFCFEPGPTMARALRTTAEGNGWTDRMHVVEAAVGATSGACEFLENLDDPLASRAVDGTASPGTVNGSAPAPVRESRAASLSVTTVPQVTIDEWVDRGGCERVDYIKIDAEGADVDVLLGARETLARWRPRVAVPAYHVADHAQRIVAYLTSLDLAYRCDVRGVVSIDGVARPVLIHAAADGARRAGSR